MQVKNLVTYISWDKSITEKQTKALQECLNCLECLNSLHMYFTIIIIIVLSF